MQLPGCCHDAVVYLVSISWVGYARYNKWSMKQESGSALHGLPVCPDLLCPALPCHVLPCPAHYIGSQDQVHVCLLHCWMMLQCQAAPLLGRTSQQPAWRLKLLLSNLPTNSYPHVCVVSLHMASPEVHTSEQQQPTAVLHVLFRVSDAQSAVWSAFRAMSPQDAKTRCQMSQPGAALLSGATLQGLICNRAVNTHVSLLPHSIGGQVGPAMSSGNLAN